MLKCIKMHTEWVLNDILTPQRPRNQLKSTFSIEKPSTFAPKLWFCKRLDAPTHGEGLSGSLIYYEFRIFDPLNSLILHHDPYRVIHWKDYKKEQKKQQEADEKINRRCSSVLVAWRGDSNPKSDVSNIVSESFSDTDFSTFDGQKVFKMVRNWL